VNDYISISEGKYDKQHSLNLFELLLMGVWLLICSC
jgi:hypothetical protein